MSHLIELIQTLLYMMAFFAYVFPLGYLCVHLARPAAFMSDGFLVRLPLYLTTGLAGMSIILFLVGQLVIERYLFLLIFGISIFVLLFKKRDKLKRTITLHLKIKTEQVFPLALIVISLLHMARVANDMGWPPPGDAISHGMLTSLFLYRKRVPWNLEPFSDFPLTNPPGFYLLASAFSLLAGTSPGKSILLLSASIGALIPLMLYSIVYYRTKSSLFSLIAFLMAFILPGGEMTNYGVFKEFFLGDYLSFFGDLLMLLFLYVVLFVDDNLAQFYLNRHLILLMLVVLSITLGYTYYILYPFLFMLVRLLIVIGSNPSNFILTIKKSAKLHWFLFIMVLSLIAIYLISRESLDYFYNYSYLVISLLKRWAVWHFNYGINPIEFLYLNVNGVIVLTAFFISILKLIRREDLPTNLLYICSFVPTVLASNDKFFFNFLWMTYPYRFIISLILLSYVVSALFMHSALIHLEERAVIRLQVLKSKFNLRHLQLAACAAILMLLAPMFYAHLTFQPQGWLTKGAILPDDFESLQWITNNIPSDALILNDRSFAGLWLLSLGIKNVVNIRGLESHPGVRERALECNQIFDNPGNYTLIRDIIQKWGIKFIFVSSDPIYHDYYVTFRYYYRPWSSSDYIHFFDTNPYLTPVFRKGDSGVYRTFLADRL